MRAGTTLLPCRQGKGPFVHLDGLTLLVPGAFAAAIACLFLLGTWLQQKSAPALLWWAGAAFVNALGIASVFAGIATRQPLVIMTGAGLAGLTPTLIWAGVRRFNGHRMPWLFLAAMPALWLFTAYAPTGIDHQRWATLVAFLSWCVIVPAVIRELWLARKDEALPARWPLMGLLALHALVFVGAVGQLIAGTFPINQPPDLYSWFGVVQFEGIVYSVGSAFFMALMCRERAELRRIEAAKLDALTGVYNHGALFEEGHRILHRCQTGGSPCSLIMFDLDHFKAINDTRGHQAGDRVLRSFAETTRGLLRPADLFGRYGGEEFMAILPGTTIEGATAIAERVRDAFAAAHRFLDGTPLNATVSAGVASAATLTALDTLIDAADSAMYVAKHSGRNRVERADRDRPRTPGKVVRIA